MSLFRTAKKLYCVGGKIWATLVQMTLNKPTGVRHQNTWSLIKKLSVEL